MTSYFRVPVLWLGLGILAAAPLPVSWAAEAPMDARPAEHLKVRLSWGHSSASARSFHMELVTNNVAVGNLQGVSLETGDLLTGSTCDTRAGSGDVDALSMDVWWTRPTQPARKPHETWAYLLQHGTPDQVARLKDDPGLTPEAPILTVQTDKEGTRGFSVGLEQLSRHKAMWLPGHDVFVAVDEPQITFAKHVASLKGQRVLDRVKRQPEATLERFQGVWEDIGNPNQWTVPWQTEWLGTVGHLIGTAATHGSLFKFGVDRWGKVRPDYASPHRFRLDPLWPDSRWVEQKIVNGLPIIVTRLERGGQTCQLEQFAAAVPGPTPARPTETQSVFCTRVRLAGSGTANFGLRLSTETTNRHPALREIGGRQCVVDAQTGAVWLMIEPGPKLTIEARALRTNQANPQIELNIAGELAEGASDILIKLASPPLLPDAAPGLAALDFERARRATIQYWEDWLAQGARFQVPEREINELFRANLWHALMLPRFRDADRIDLPYSNFAYGQLNADWPINQAVYVDYMLYGLRGYFAVAEQEFAAMYRTQQKPDGRVSGYAEWGVYSPGMLYSIAQNHLLSGDRSSFERLLPASLKAMDWCLNEVAQGQQSKKTPGLIIAPLNDLTHDSRAWGFPNAYFAAGLELFARALAVFGHPRAGQVQSVARKMHVDLEREFARGSVKSPVVQLADGSWNNYVPCDALTPRRLLDVWYPTDVDCGPLHLARLEAIDPRGWLATAMLHDHEDNLFLKQQGMANEPIYNQQATAYLLRDEPEAAIRAFYSMIPCAFSHRQYSPLEHRWAWGQYYGPPSTDGAWFDLYRHMLIHEREGETLLLGQATPRKWLEDGKSISVERAPTYFGALNLRIESKAASGEISANVGAAWRTPPKALTLRLRHPHKLPMRSVLVNGKPWIDFDPSNEWIRIPQPHEQEYRVVARY